MGWIGGNIFQALVESCTSAIYILRRYFGVNSIYQDQRLEKSPPVLWVLILICILSEALFIFFFISPEYIGGFYWFQPRVNLLVLQAVCCIVSWQPCTSIRLYSHPMACCFISLLLQCWQTIINCASSVKYLVAAFASSRWTKWCLRGSSVSAGDILNEAPVILLDSEPLAHCWGVVGDTSATTLISVWNTRVFRTALTALMEPRTLWRRITCYTSPRRRVALHTYLLYFAVTYTHHQNDTCVTLFAGAAAMLKPFTQRLAIDDKPGSTWERRRQTWERRRHVWEHLESQSCIQFVFSSRYLYIYIATHLQQLYLDCLQAVLERNSRCAWEWRWSELRDYSEAVIERLWSCTWRR